MKTPLNDLLCEAHAVMIDIADRCGLDDMTLREAAVCEAIESTPATVREISKIVGTGKESERTSIHHTIKQLMKKRVVRRNQSKGKRVDYSLITRRPRTEGVRPTK